LPVFYKYDTPLGLKSCATKYYISERVISQ
jgi:hypothetical protein